MHYDPKTMPPVLDAAKPNISEQMIVGRVPGDGRENKEKYEINQIVLVQVKGSVIGGEGNQGT